MHYRLHADFVLSLWSNKSAWRWLGIFLLTLALSGCTAGVQGQVSHYDQVIATNERALENARIAHNRVAEGRALHTLGRAYSARGQSATAKAYLTQALAIWRTEGDRTQEGRTLIALGLVYRALSQYDKALTFYEQALTIAREVGDRRGEGLALGNLGGLYQALGQYDKALAFQEQALVIMREVGNRAGEGTACIYLMTIWKAQRQPRLAIFYGKQAINVFQEIRGTLLSLAQELQEGFLASRAPVYRQLAELLMETGRLPEASRCWIC